MNHDDFDALFERFERSAFRLEARDRYNVPDEQEGLTAFLNGQQLPRSAAPTGSTARRGWPASGAGRPR
jgi:hypothetical protein